MQRFRDADGREWEVSLDIPAAKRIWQRLQVNLRARNDLARLTGDESLWLIPDVLYVLCETQAAKRYERLAGDVSELSAEFGRMLEPVFAVASRAFFEELTDFCRRLGMQATARLTEALAKRLATQEAAEDQAYGAKLAPAMDAEIDRELAKRVRILDRILGTNAGSLPESSDSGALTE